MRLAKQGHMEFGTIAIVALLGCAVLLGMIYLYMHRYETHLGGLAQTIVFTRDTWTGGVTMCLPSGACRRLE